MRFSLSSWLVLWLKSGGVKDQHPLGTQPQHLAEVEHHPLDPSEASGGFYITAYIYIYIYVLLCSVICCVTVSLTSLSLSCNFGPVLVLFLTHVQRFIHVNHRNQVLQMSWDCMILLMTFLKVTGLNGIFLPVSCNTKNSCKSDIMNPVYTHVKL